VFGGDRVNVSLTAELERFVNEKVESGAYSSASEVIREGLRLLRERDELRRVRTEGMRRDIMLGAEQIREGRGKKYGGGTELAGEVKRRGRQREWLGRGGAE
jgi:antitoxin ParD1/3/4